LQGIREDTTKIYSLSFVERSTAFDLDNGKLTLSLDNKPDNKFRLGIYGLQTTGTINTTLFATDLSNVGGKEIKHEKIRFIPENITLDKITKDPKIVDIEIDNSIVPGTYSGWIIFLTGQNATSIPLTASTQPIFDIAIGWVIVGILASVGFWELVKYADIRRNEAIEKESIGRANDLNRQLRERYGTDAYRLTTTLANDRAVAKVYQEAQDQIRMNIVTAANARSDIKKAQERLATSKGKARVAIIDIGSAGFGIALAFLALFNDAFVTNLQVIDSIEIWTLFGIGLGVGSLKEIVDKK
jgi:hypothetical protein